MCLVINYNISPFFTIYAIRQIPITPFFVFSSHFTCRVQNYFLSLQSLHAEALLAGGTDEVGDAIYEKALSNALSFDSSESGSSKLIVKNKATEALIRYVISLWYQHIAWASALLVQTIKAMPEPRRVGRVTDLTPTLLLYISSTHY